MAKVKQLLKTEKKMGYVVGGAYEWNQISLFFL
jgi:hypothetical protein